MPRKTSAHGEGDPSDRTVSGPPLKPYRIPEAQTTYAYVYTRAQKNFLRILGLGILGCIVAIPAAALLVPSGKFKQDTLAIENERPTFPEMQSTSTSVKLPVELPVLTMALPTAETNPEIIETTTVASTSTTELEIETTIPDTVPPIEPLTTTVATVATASPPESTAAPQKHGEAFLPGAKCTALGGHQEVFPADGRGPWEIIGAYYHLTQYQIGRVFASDIPDTFHLNAITAGIKECMPPEQLIQAAAPVASPPADSNG